MVVCVVWGGSSSHGLISWARTDLKPANCLIDLQGCVKIADMNISKVSKGGNMQVQHPHPLTTKQTRSETPPTHKRTQTRAHIIHTQTQVGTPYFICPEIYLKRPYSSTSDIWSLGGVLYNLAALHPPFLADKYVQFAALFSGVCAEGVFIVNM